MLTRACAHCGVSFASNYLRKLTCSPDCAAERKRAEGRRSSAVRHSNCIVCDTPLLCGARRRPRKFCGSKCRRIDFKRRHADEATLEFDGEILVRDLEECPRRLRLARFIDRFEGGRIFCQGAVRPIWISPPRAGR
jgi:endogenous inhibitor of DNA gyrase (YacG/DUF329 family)